MRTNRKKVEGERGEWEPITFRVVGYTSRFIRLAATLGVRGGEGRGFIPPPGGALAPSLLQQQPNSQHLSVCARVFRGKSETDLPYIV